MRDLFQRRGRSGTETGVARLTLGAFGKHPGWDDHILGIGVETETLARLKQALYVGGIGAQIDSGAWEKLDAEKRLPGFDHIFLSQQPGHVMLGQLWSSTDGKGRSKYPMVLCIDGEGVSPGFMVKVLLGGLDRLRSACKSTTSADQVARDCRSGQEQLRAMLAQDPSRLSDPGLSSEHRRRFVEHPRFGPDRLGFLRALHELKAAPVVASNGRATTTSNVRPLRSSHLRLPLGADSPKDGLLLWAALLRCIVPDNVPLLLLVRAGVDWLDVLLSEPGPDDFFCLQAGPKALPLATDIPYQLEPDLKQRWQELEAKFLGVQPAAATTVAISAVTSAPSSPPPQPAPLARAPEPVPPPTPVAPVPPPPQKREPSPPTFAPAAPRAQTASKLPLVAVVVLILLAIAAAWYFLHPAQKPTARAGNPLDTVQIPGSGKAAAPAESAERAYQNAMTAARAARENKNFSTAIAQAQLALQAKSGDAQATALLQESKQAAATAAEKEQKYEAATNAAGLALLQMNYQDATNQAALALAARPDDAIASKMLAEAQQGLGAGAQQQKYQTAIEAGKAAFDAQKYSDATNQAAIALAVRPGDPVASKLQTDASSALEKQTVAAQQLQKIKAATNAAAAALSQTNYQQAMRQAELALAIRTNDPVALDLKARAETAQALATAQNYFARGDYAKAADLCRNHPGNDAFSSLAASIATEQSALAEANSSLSNGDYTLLDRLNAQGYAAKSPFAKLVAQAQQEKASLDSLRAIKQTNGWQEVQKRFTNSDLIPLSIKPPFAALRSWANAQTAAPAATPDQTLRRLDNRLEMLLVQFEVLKPTSPEVKSDEARHAQPIPDGVIDNGFYLNQVDSLEAGFRQGGWLDQANRKVYLDKLRKAINVR